MRVATLETTSIFNGWITHSLSPLILQTIECPTCREEFQPDGMYELCKNFALLGAKSAVDDIKALVTEVAIERDHLRAEKGEQEMNAQVRATSSNQIRNNQAEPVHQPSAELQAALAAEQDKVTKLQQELAVRLEELNECRVQLATAVSNETETAHVLNQLLEGYTEV